MKAFHQTLVIIGCIGLLAALPAVAQGPEEFTGRIIDVAGSVPGPSTSHVRLHIEEYTPPEELQKLATVLVEEGPEALEKMLYDLDRGWIRVGDRLGYPIAAARSIDTGNGDRVIRVLTDRPIQFFELRAGLRSRDYPFGILEIALDAEGKGEGQLIAAAKIEITKEGTIEIESLGVKPFKLTSVQLQD